MNPELEKLIGKDINEVKKTRKILTKLDGFYSFEIEKEEKFYGLQYSNLRITVNSNKIIESISIVFSEILNRIFYDEMIKHYGYPNNILAIDKLVVESKSKDVGESGFMQNLAKKIYSMKEVSFNNNPRTVVWNKGVYQIHINFFYNEKATQLVFNKIKN